MNVFSIIAKSIEWSGSSAVGVAETISSDQPAHVETPALTVPPTPSGQVVQKRGIIDSWALYDRRDFRPDNPILKQLEVEGRVFDSGDVNKARQEVLDIVNETRVRLKRQEIAQHIVGASPLTAEQKLRTVYQVMYDRGYRYRYMDQLTPGLLAKRLDCDTSSSVVLAAAYEMGWPVHGVLVPNHFFVRWNDGQGIRFNMDYGEVYEDEYYRRRFKISTRAEENGFYLRDIPYEKLEATTWMNVAYFLKGQGRSQEALVACDQAFRIDPLTYDVLAMRGSLRGSEADVQMAIDVNPNDREARLELARQAMAKKDPKKALTMFQEAYDLDPRDPQPVLGASQVFLENKEYESAIYCANAAIELAATQYANETVNAAMSVFSEGDLLPLDGTIDRGPLKAMAQAYFGRAAANLGKGDLGKAIQDLKTAIEI